MKKLSKKFENILYWQVLLLIVFVPLYLKFPLISVQGTFVSVRLEDIIIAITILTWLVYMYLSGRFRTIFKNTIVKLILVFFFVGAVSTVSGVFLTKSVVSHIGIFHLLRRVEFLLLLPVAYYTIKSKRQVIFYLITLSVVLFIVNFYGMGQKYLEYPAVSTINTELSKGYLYTLNQFDRINSTFAGHYDLAIFMVMAISLLLPFVFSKLENISKFKDKNILPFIWFSFLTIFSGIILVFTAARLSFLAGFFAVAFVIFLFRKYKLMILLLLAAVIFMLYPSHMRNRIISTFTVNILGNWQSYQAVNEEQEVRSRLNIPTLPFIGKRIESVGVESPDIAPGEPVDNLDLAIYRSFNIRINVEWPRALQAFERNPLLGSGYSSIGLATDNGILRSLGEVGILGTWAFVLIFVEIIKRLIKAFKKKDELIKLFSAGCLTMVFALIVNSLFIDVFEASKTSIIFWLILGISLGFSDLKSKYVEK